MPPERYTPTQTARHAGVSPNTVRVWAREYKDFLSEYANPAPGVDRSFTATDVATIQAIAQLRGNNLITADVKERLRQQPPQAPDTLHDATNATNEAPDTPPVTNAIVPAHDAIQAFLQRTDIDDRLRDVDRRLERMEHNRNLLIAFAAGAVTVAVIVWLVLTFMSR